MTLTHHLTGELTEKKAAKTIARLGEMHDVHPDTGWLFTISSDGGLLTAGDAIYSELYSYSLRGGGTHPVTTRVRGQAASAATLIFQAGDWREMGKMDRLLLHQPRLCCEDLLSLHEIRNHVRDLENWLDNYADVHTARSSLDRQTFLVGLGNSDWIVYAEEAIRLGLADAIG